jgi:hypothetical protein
MYVCTCFSLFLTAGNLLIFVAYGFAAQSLLSALETVQFVSNVAFAKLVHGEVGLCVHACARCVLRATCCVLRVYVCVWM